MFAAIEILLQLSRILYVIMSCKKLLENTTMIAILVSLVDRIFVWQC